MSKEILTFNNKEYVFTSDRHGRGIIMVLDGIKVLLPTHIIMRLLKMETNKWIMK